MRGSSSASDRRRPSLRSSQTSTSSAVRAHLDSARQIIAGDPEGGPLAKLAAPERFRWIAAPSSTMIQPSDVHGGMTEDPAGSLADLFERLVH